MTLEGITDMEVGKVRAGEYLIEGFRVYRDSLGDWVIEDAQHPMKCHSTLRSAKRAIYNHLTGVLNITQEVTR